jgi:hypothetical protein
MIAIVFAPMDVPMGRKEQAFSYIDACQGAAAAGAELWGGRI